MIIKKEIEVLIIDDDFVARLINKKVVQSFEEFDITIHEAISGVTALEFLRDKYQQNKAYPKVIILDTAMPIMSGFDFIEAYSQLPNSNRTSIIIVTASSNPEDIENAKSLGVNYYFTKPVSFDKLKFAILTIMEGAA